MTVILALGLAALIALYWPVAVAAVRVWEASTSYNHCFLIPLISAYLLWERRDTLARMQPRPVLWPLPAILGLSLVALLGNVMSILEIQQFALVGMMQAFVLAVVGWPVFRVMLFPMFYLFFMVPTGEFLVPQLQDFTAAFVVLGLQLAQIPVFLDGVFIRIPNGLFEVAEACAGLRFLIANVAFGFLFAHMMYRGWRKRAVFIALSVIVPIFANGLRAFGIVMIAHLSDNKLAAGVDHIVYGWGFFVAIMLAMMWVGLQFRDADADDTARVALQSAPQASRAFGIVVATAALVLASVAPAAAYWLDHRVPDHAITLTAPTPGGSWQLAAPAADGWGPTFNGADADLSQTYLGPDGAVHLYVAYFASQRHGAKIISAQNRLEVEDVWRRASSGTANAVIDDRAMPVATQILTSNNRTRRVAWTVYWVDRQFTASSLRAKLFGARGTLLSGHPQAAAIVLAADVTTTEEEAAARMQDLLRNLPPLADMLGQAAAR